MSTQPFKFKQFEVAQERCAMKIGTDGVLLGAWAPVDHNPFSILDIGAGSGLISLMLAQRSHAELIDAVEINADAYEQCVENFEASVWNDRLFCYHASLEEFTDEIEDLYELIVSNPPFFSETYPSGNDARDAARQNQSLPPSLLVNSVCQLLHPKGVFALIIPFKEEKQFLQLARDKNLYPFAIKRVKGSHNTPVKRSLIALSFNEKSPVETELVIESNRHEYTEGYISLTKDFYLKM